MAAHGLIPYRAPLPDVPGVTDRTLGVSWPEASPPFALFLFQGFGILPFDMAEHSWLIVSVIAYVAAVGMIAHGRPGTLSGRAVFFTWALATQAIAQTVQERQIYVLTMLLVLGAQWAWTHHKLGLAALCVGLLVALKPNLAIWVAAMAVSGDLALALMAGGWAIGACAAAALVYGPSMYLAWLGQSSRFSADVPFNGSVFALARALGHPEYAQRIGLPIAAALCLGLLFWAWRCRPPREHLAFAALAIGFFAAPLAWYGNLLVLVPFLGRATWRLQLILLGILMVLPVGTMVQLVAAIAIAFLTTDRVWTTATPSAPFTQGATGSHRSPVSALD